MSAVDTVVIQTTEVVEVNGVEVVVIPGPVEVVTAGIQGPPGIAGPASVATFLAGEALSALRVVRIDPATGKAFYASASAAADANVAVGVTLTSAPINQAVSVRTEGQLSDLNWSWNTAGERRVYLGTNGALVQGVPGGAAFSQQVATVSSAQSLVVNIQPAVLV